MLSIRLARPEDRDRILYINRLSWQVAYKHIFSSQEISSLFRGELQQNGTWLIKRKERLTSLLAEVDGEVVGFLGMACLLNDTAAEITSLYLLPDYQGQGIGTKLWETALEKLRTEAYTGVWVWVLGKSEARYFYVARGGIEKARGIYTIGNHQEETLGYFINFDSACK